MRRRSANSPDTLAESFCGAIKRAGENRPEAARKSLRL